MKRLVILTPLVMEGRAVARALGCGAPGRGRPSSCTRGELSVHVYLVGMGARELPELAEAPDGVVLAGLAGSIDGRYGVGDVVVGLTSTWLAELPYPKVGVCYSDRPVLSAHSKECAGYATGDQIVEMESEPVKRWAAKRGYPLLHLRAISDGHKEEIDPAVLGLVDPFGRARVGKVVWALVRRPGLMKELMRLNGIAKRGLKALGEAMMLVVNTFE